MDPVTRKNTWRGERRAALTVLQARLTDGITALRTRGMPRTAITTTPNNSTTTNSSRTSPSVGMSANVNLSGLAASAANINAMDTTTLATDESNPPDATADARSTP